MSIAGLTENRRTMCSCVSAPYRGNSDLQLAFDFNPSRSLKRDRLERINESLCQNSFGAPHAGGSPNFPVVGLPPAGPQCFEPGTFGNARLETLSLIRWTTLIRENFNIKPVPLPDIRHGAIDLRARQDSRVAPDGSPPRSWFWPGSSGSIDAFQLDASPLCTGGCSEETWFFDQFSPDDHP